MLTVKLTKSSSSDPQDTGLEPVANPPCWGSETAVSLNLTIPLRILDGLDERPAPELLMARSEVWRPRRSVAAWFLWRLTDKREGDRGPARPCGLGASRSAQTGGVRPPPPPGRESGRAPLRGAASHKAEGRGGGAGRVGPPPGWPRLRLLRQILDELVPGVEQFLLVDNVVAVEDGAALVPGQKHGDPLGHAGADQVAGGGAATIVEEAGRHPSGLAGGAPRRAPAPDGDPVAVEDERAVGVAACPPSVQRVGDGGRDRENPPDQGLRAPWREPDDAASLVDFAPSEAEDFILAPAGVVGEVEDVLPRGGQVGADGEVFGVLEEALAGRILAEPVGEAGHGVEPAPVDGEGAHAVEGRGLAIDGAGGGPGGAPGQLILADLVGGQRGGPRGAAEERGEMSNPAAGGALGPELPPPGSPGDRRR